MPVSCQLSQLSLRKWGWSRGWALCTCDFPPSQQPGHAPGVGSTSQRAPETGTSVTTWVGHASNPFALPRLSFPHQAFCLWSRGSNPGHVSKAPGGLFKNAPPRPQPSPEGADSAVGVLGECLSPPPHQLVALIHRPCPESQKLLCSLGHTPLCLIDHSPAQGNMGGPEGRTCRSSYSNRCDHCACLGQWHQALSPPSSHRIPTATLAVWWQHQPQFTGEEPEAGQSHTQGTQVVTRQRSSQPHWTPSAVPLLYCQVASQRATHSRTCPLHPISFSWALSPALSCLPLSPAGAGHLKAQEGCPGQDEIRADRGFGSWGYTPLSEVCLCKSINSIIHQVTV